MCLHALKRRGQSRNSTDPSNIAGSLKLTYPTHPFSSDLCKLISELPSGFQDVALTTKLSNQFLILLRTYTHDINERLTTEKITAPIVDELTMSLGQLAIAPGITPFEMSLCSALLVFRAVVSNTNVPSRLVDRVHDVANSVFDLDDEAQNLKEGPRKAIRNCLLWTVMVAAGTVTPNLLDAQTRGLSKEQKLMLIGEMTRRHTGFRKDWDALATVLEKFYWRDNIGEQWKELWMWWRDAKQDWKYSGRGT